MSRAIKGDQKAATDAAAWMFNVVTSVGIIIVNKTLMARYGYSFGTYSTNMLPKYLLHISVFLCLFASELNG